MAKIFAYLRVSTDAQDVANQKLGVLEYCAKKGMAAPLLIEDTVSSKTPWRDRGIGQLLAGAAADDAIVVAEISRLARSTLQVLEIMHAALERGVHVHVVKNGIVLDNSIQSKVFATFFGLAAEIEREFIVSRTVEALARKKAEGVKLGRRPGQQAVLPLDKEAAKIDEYLRIGLNKTAISKLLGVSKGTLYTWLQRRRPEVLNRTAAQGELPV